MEYLSNAIYDTITEPVTITCHIIGANLDPDSDFVWIHNGGK